MMKRKMTMTGKGIDFKGEEDAEISTLPGIIIAVTA